jgi:hypothetical protein
MRTLRPDRREEGGLMPVISRKIVKGRCSHVCGMCNRHIAKGEEHVRLYGSAERSDPKYVLRLHVACEYPSVTATKKEEV